MPERTLAPGTRVLAVSHVDNVLSEDGKTLTRTIFAFGEGVYDGDLPCPALDYRTNPRITLDSGETVWGMECWWGPVEQMQKQYPDSPITAVSIATARAENEAPDPGVHMTERELFQRVRATHLSLAAFLLRAAEAGNPHATKFAPVADAMQKAMDAFSLAEE